MHDAVEPPASPPASGQAPGQPATGQPATGQAPGDQRSASTAEDLATLDAAERLLDDVDHALRRLEAGSFGTCEACDGPIGEQRLVHLPTARTCEDHPQLTDDAVAP